MKILQTINTAREEDLIGQTTCTGVHDWSDFFRGIKIPRTHLLQDVSPHPAFYRPRHNMLCLEQVLRPNTAARSRCQSSNCCYIEALNFCLRLYRPPQGKNTLTCSYSVKLLKSCFEESSLL